MKVITLETPAIIKNTEKEFSDNTKIRITRWSAVLYLSIAGGLSCTSTGLVLGAISYLGMFKDSDAVNQLGNFLIIAAFPLMMLGAHALDKINQIKTEKKQP
jgi:hypothetical protein